VANRALLLASLAKGESWLSGLPPPGELSEDITAMMGALRALGAGMEFADGRLRVRGGAVLAPAGALDAGAAGTVLRFLLPVAALH
jgi:5-enolpyruvylshikimate-3-phosphate synthase